MKPYYRNPEFGERGRFVMGETRINNPNDVQLFVDSYGDEYKPYVQELLSEGWDMDNPRFDEMVEGRMELDRSMDDWEAPLFIDDEDVEAFSTDEEDYRMNRPRGSMGDRDARGRKKK